MAGDGRGIAMNPLNRVAGLADNEQAALLDYLTRLREICGNRILRVILFGSKARGDSGPESDIDLFVVLQGELDGLKRTLIDLSYEISLNHGVVLSDLVVGERRYHWMSEHVEDFVCEPHAAVCCDEKTRTLNMVAQESDGARGRVAEIARWRPEKILKEYAHVQTLDLKRHHFVDEKDIRPENLHKILITTYERSAENFETLLDVATDKKYSFLYLDLENIRAYSNFDVLLWEK